MQTTDLAAIEASRLGYIPDQQPLHHLPRLPRIPSRYLRPDFLRQRLAQPIDWAVEPLFAQEFVHTFAAYPDARQAAVCVPLIEREQGLSVLLTRRAGHLVHHAGQICFPGGRVERTDQSAIHTALRETHEEVGIAPHFIQALSEEPIFITSSRFAMRPVVALVQPDFQIHIDPAEVAEVFEVPLTVLMDPTHHQLHRLQKTQQPVRYYFSMRWQNYFIWGATALVIRNLYHHLAALVQHVEATKP